MNTRVDGSSNTTPVLARDRAFTIHDPKVFARTDDLRNAPTLPSRMRSNTLPTGDTGGFRQPPGVEPTARREPPPQNNPIPDEFPNEIPDEFANEILDDVGGDNDNEIGDIGLIVHHDYLELQDFDPPVDEPVDHDLEQLGEEVKAFAKVHAEVEKSVNDTKIDKAVSNLFGERNESRTTLPQKIAGYFSDLFDKIAGKIEARRERKELEGLTGMQRLDRMHEKMCGGPSQFNVHQNRNLVLDLFTTDFTDKVIPSMDGKDPAMANLSNTLTKVLADVRSDAESRLRSEIGNAIEKNPAEKDLPKAKRDKLVEQRVKERLPETLKQAVLAFAKEIVAGASHLQRSKIDLDQIQENLVIGFVFSGHKDKEDFVQAVLNELKQTPVEVDPEQIKLDRLDRRDQLAAGRQSNARHGSTEVLTIAGKDFSALSNDLTSILEGIRADFHSPEKNPDNVNWLDFLGAAARSMVLRSDPGPLALADPKVFEQAAKKFEAEGQKDKEQICLTLQHFILQAKTPEGASEMFQDKIMARMEIVKDQNTFFRGNEYSAVGNMMNALGKSEHAKIFPPIIKEFVNSEEVVQLDKEIKSYRTAQEELAAKSKKPVQPGSRQELPLSPELAKRVLDLALKFQDKLMASTPPKGMTQQIALMGQVLENRSKDDYVEKGGDPENKLDPKKVQTLTHLLYNNELVLRHISPSVTTFKDDQPDTTIKASNLQQGKDDDKAVDKQTGIEGPTMKTIVEVLQKIGNSVFKASGYRSPEVGNLVVQEYGKKLVDRQEQYFINAGMPETAKVEFKAPVVKPIEPNPIIVKN